MLSIKQMRDTVAQFLSSLWSKAWLPLDRSLQTCAKATTVVLSHLLQRPWTPLVLFAFVIAVGYFFDSHYIKRIGKSISLDAFAWQDPLTNTVAAVRELTARLTIEIVELIKFLMTIAVLLLSLATIRNFWSKLSLRQAIWWALFVVIAVLAYRVLWFQWLFDIPNPYFDNSLISELPNKAKEITNRPTSNWELFGHLTHLALVAVALAAGVVILKPGDDEAELHRQLKALTHLLYACAILIVAHIAGQGAGFLWPAALLKHGSDEAVALNGLAIATTVNNAVIYTCLLFAIHIPAVYSLTTQANCLPNVLAMPPEQRKEWLLKHGLAETWPQYYLRLGAVLSPLIAGIPLTKLLTIALG